MKNIESTTFNLTNNLISDTPTELKTEINEVAKTNEEFVGMMINMIKAQNKAGKYENFQSSAYFLRGHVIGWLQQINDKLEYSAQTMFRTISIFDSFMEKTKNYLITKLNIQLYAATCYFISIKLEEVHTISLDFVRKEILKEKFSLEEINKTEFEILKKVNFKLSLPTIQNFSDLYIEYLFCPSSTESQLVNSMNYFVNIMSTFVDDLFFDISPSRLAAINLNTTLLLLEDTYITKQHNLNSSIYNIIMELNEENRNSALKISTELKEAILGEVNNSKRKIFFDLYFNCLSQTRNSQQ